MDYEIKPYQGVGLILFGMPRMEVRRLIGGRHKTISKGSKFGNLSDSFVDVSAFVYYDGRDLCRAVEFWHPMGNPVFLQVHLLESRLSDVLELFQKNDPEVNLNCDGLTSFKFGIGIWHESGFEEPEEKPQSVIAFRRGYYEE